MRIRSVLLVLLCVATPLTAQEQQFADLGTCELESGAQLEDCRVGYITIGELNEARSPDLDGHDVALWEAYKRLFRWAAECECAEAAETIAALGALNSTTSDQAQARAPGEAIKAQIEGTSTDPLPLGRAIDLIRQANAMMATDVARSFEDDWAAAAASVQAEMLVIVGASDHVVTPGPAVEFAGLLGDSATLIVFENDCGHNIPGCEMFRARSLIREFLRQD